MRVKVHVKSSHIRRGFQQSLTCCPIALAVKTKVKRGLIVHVCGDLLIGEPHTDKEIVSYLPLKAQNFINTFDRNPKSAVKPFSFIVNIPSKYVRAWAQEVQA